MLPSRSYCKGGAKYLKVQLGFLSAPAPIRALINTDAVETGAPRSSTLRKPEVGSTRLTFAKP